MDNSPDQIDRFTHRADRDFFNNQAATNHWLDSDTRRDVVAMGLAANPDQFRVDLQALQRAPRDDDEPDWGMFDMVAGVAITAVGCTVGAALHSPGGIIFSLALGSFYTYVGADAYFNPDHLL